MTRSVDTPSSGTVSFRGYVYQLDVSVWAALFLMLERNLAAFLEIEPATEEDLESEIDGEPGAAIEGVELEAYRLVIQCKLRTTGPWKVRDLSRLVSHGVRRQKVKDRLRDRRVRYVLVTSADLDGIVRPLDVPSLTEWPPVGAMPAELANELPPDAGGRFAVLARMDPERVDFRTDTLLMVSFRVPRGLLASCRDALRKEVFRRMQGEAGGRWTREDIERTIRDHKGYVGTAPELDDYVQPDNWRELKQALAVRHAVVIAGPSGSGKSTAAKALIAELRDETPGLNVEYIGAGPEKILSYQGSLPVVFEVEDAWGRFELEPKARAWTHAIGEVLRRARHDFKIIITTRADVLLESHDKTPKKWFVTLDEASYSYEQRVAMFEGCAEKLPRALQEKVIRFRSNVVEQLTTPLYMQRYFDVVAEGPKDEEHDQIFVNRCIAEAEQISIEASLLAKIRDREDCRWATVVWALFKTGPQQSTEALRSVQVGLTKRDLAFEDGLERFARFLVASHDLRERDGLLAYHHPRVELGLQQALLEAPGVAGRTLRYMVETFVELDARQPDTGQAEKAARVARAARRLGKLDLELRPETQRHLDSWLRARVLEGGPDFEDDLSLAAEVGSNELAAAELARWLTEKADTRYMFLEEWAPREMSDEWYGRISSDPATKPICEMFIRRMLPRLNGSYTMQFPEELTRLADGLANAFCDAALMLTDDAYNSNAEVIARGALADLERFGAVVEAAVGYEMKLRERDDDGFWLAVQNGEYADEAADHYAEDRGGDGYCAGVMLDEYATHLRKALGWHALRDHSYAAALRRYWVRAAYRDRDNAPVAEEWTALMTALYDSIDERLLWDAPEGTWPAIISQHLLARIRNGSPDAALRREASVALTRFLAAEIPAVVQELEKSAHEPRILELVLDVQSAYEHLADDAGQRAIEVVANSASAPLAELVLAVLDPAGSNSLDTHALELLNTIDAGANSTLRVAQARLLARGGLPVTGLLKRVLIARGDDSEDEIAAIKRAMELAGELQEHSLVEIGLDHRFADVREVTLNIMAGRSTGALPTVLLSLATDRGSRVRQALMTLLDARRDATHTDALLRIAADTWSARVDHYGDDSVCPIARQAAKVLSAPPLLSDECIPRIAEIVKSSSDAVVRETLLHALVVNGSEEARRRVERATLKGGNFRLALAAAKALVNALGKVDFVLSADLSAQILMQRPPVIAVRLAALAGAWAAEEHLLALADNLSRNTSKRVLLVPMWFGANRCGREAAAVVEKLLPRALMGHLRRALTGESRAARDALDDLGDVRTVTRVRELLEPFFEA